MPLGAEVGRGPGDSVLDGDPDPPRQMAKDPNFRPMSIVQNGRPSQLLVSIC